MAQRKSTPQNDFNDYDYQEISSARQKLNDSLNPSKRRRKIPDHMDHQVNVWEGTDGFMAHVRIDYPMPMILVDNVKTVHEISDDDDDDVQEIGLDYKGASDRSLKPSSSKTETQSQIDYTKNKVHQDNCNNKEKNKGGKSGKSGPLNESVIICESEDDVQLVSEGSETDIIIVQDKSTTHKSIIDISSSEVDTPSPCGDIRTSKLNIDDNNRIRNNGENDNCMVRCNLLEVESIDNRELSNVKDKNNLDSENGNLVHQFSKDTSEPLQGTTTILKTNNVNDDAPASNVCEPDNMVPSVNNNVSLFD